MNCNWCYEYGHNKLGCPELKEAAAPWILKWEAYKKEMQKEGNPAGSWGFRNKHDMSYRAKMGLNNYITTQNRSTARKLCNFCGEGGHNKRTCVALKKVKADLIKANIAFRHAITEALRESGQGVGSLVYGACSYWSNGGWKEETGVGVIERINWKNIDLYSCCGNSGHLNLNGPETQTHLVHWSFGQKAWIYPPQGIQDPIKGSNVWFKTWGSEKKIISPSASVSPPEEWLLCKDKASVQKLNDYFKGRKSLNHRYFTEGKCRRQIIDKWIKYGEQYDDR